MTWHDRYKAMKKALELTNADIANITGNSSDSIKTVTQPRGELPRWLKFAIDVFERMRDAPLIELMKESEKEESFATGFDVDELLKDDVDRLLEWLSDEPTYGLTKDDIKEIKQDWEFYNKKKK